jgi:2-polyprenyl-3-methyl-5-hydroxy-6-metoxy-1,4-benzoquinol methylase
VRIDLEHMREGFRGVQAGKESRHAVADRVHPSRWQYDYLTLSRLSRDVRALLAELPERKQGRALDLGSDKSPYREVLASRGYEVRTLDITRDGGADYAGTAEATGLPDASFDLVLCTQVIEHCMNPWAAMREIHRILRPGGHLIVSAPHVWFYHPHPTDNWRYTQEGMAHLCREAGLEPVTLLAQGGSVLTLFQVLNFLAYGILGRAGAPLYAALNVAGALGDRLAPNELFCHNFACLSQKPVRGEW